MDIELVEDRAIRRLASEHGPETLEVRGLASGEHPRLIVGV
jgi:hypothetical protein